MNSETKDHQIVNSNENVLNNQFSSGNLKLNVSVRVKYNTNDNANDNLNDMNDHLNYQPSDNLNDHKLYNDVDLNKQPIKKIVSNDTRSLYDETLTMSSNNEATDKNHQDSINNSSFLKSLTSSLQSSKSFSSTPIKRQTIETVDRALPKNYFEDDLKNFVQHSEHLDDTTNEPFEFSSLSSDSSLISNNSTASKNSQSTEQLYNCDEEKSDKNPVVQVCVRIRPMNRFEINNHLIKKIVDVDELNSTLNFKDRRNSNEIRYRFKFNQIFYSKHNKSLEDDQQEIYTKIGQPYLQNLLEGNDLCYFAYGQTGSGKSYTIMGDESTAGLVFRFAKQLFEVADLNKREDLDPILCKSPVDVKNSKEQNSDPPANKRNGSNENIILLAKKQVQEASLKYGFTDVIDGFLPNNSSFDNIDSKTFEQCPNDKSKDKILRFNENIECYEDGFIYHDKLLNASESEMSSMDSFQSLEHRCELEYNSIDKQNLNILKNILIKFGNQSDNLKIEFSFKISFYEIYSENIYDLLEANEERIKSKVREHPTSGPYIVNLTMKEINSIKELNYYYELGNKRRSKNSTHSNEKSSRSHAAFTIYVTQTHHYQATLVRTSSKPVKTTRTSQIHSKISFVDLAGSERASTSDPINDERLKEGNSINKSLLTLGKVITKLAWINKCIKKKKTDIDVAKNSTNPIFYVPYRDSGKKFCHLILTKKRITDYRWSYKSILCLKFLTWLLKDCFNGKCKTFMIATIAPSSNHYDQTLSTLRYAHKASKIKVSFKFNQIPIHQLINEKSSTDDSRRIYIENMECLKNKLKKVETDNVMNDLKIANIDRIGYGMVNYKTDEKLKDELKNEPNVDHINESINLITNINSKLNKKYESHLIEKIKELFKDYL